jgi:hypothetical protein
MCVPCVAGLATTACLATPILLVEFRHNEIAVERSIALPTTVPFDFDAYDPTLSLSYLGWLEEYGPTDVGMTFLAPTEIVEGANLAIASPTSKYLLETGPANFSSERSFYLPSHTVTSVERIVDQLTITRTQGDLYFLEAAQRIQIWGVPIPEPNTIALFIIPVVHSTMLPIRRGHRRADRARSIEHLNFAIAHYLATQSPHQPVPFS